MVIEDRALKTEDRKGDSVQFIQGITSPGVIQQQILQGISAPEIGQEQETIVVVQNVDEGMGLQLKQENVSMEEVQGLQQQPVQRVQGAVATSSQPADSLVMKKVISQAVAQAAAAAVANNSTATSIPNNNAVHVQVQQQPGNQSEFQMGSVLSAIASHLSKNSGKGLSVEEQLARLQHLQHIQIPQQGQQHGIQQIQVQQEDGEPITVVTLPQSSAQQSVPSPVHDVTVSDDVMTEQVIHTVSSSSDLPFSASKRQRLEFPADSLQSDNAVYIRADSLPPGTVLQTIETENGTFTVTQVGTVDSSGTAPAPEIYGPCPICGDRISGEHHSISLPY